MARIPSWARMQAPNTAPLNEPLGVRCSAAARHRAPSRVRAGGHPLVLLGALPAAPPLVQCHIHHALLKVRGRAAQDSATAATTPATAPATAPETAPTTAPPLSPSSLTSLPAEASGASGAVAGAYGAASGSGSGSTSSSTVRRMEMGAPSWAAPPRPRLRIDAHHGAHLGAHHDAHVPWALARRRGQHGSRSGGGVSSSSTHGGGRHATRRCGHATGR